MLDPVTLQWGGGGSGLLQRRERQLLDFGRHTERWDSRRMKQKGTFSTAMDMVTFTVRTVQCFSEEVAWVGGLPDVSTVLDM